MLRTGLFIIMFLSLLWNNVSITNNRTVAAAGCILAVKAGGDTVRKSEGQIRSAAVNKAVPKYPQKAIDDKIEGDVEVEITIDEEGKVISSKASSGPDIFYQSCEEAALQWAFTPFKVAGKPTKVVGILTFRFLLK